MFVWKERRTTQTELQKLNSIDLYGAQNRRAIGMFPVAANESTRQIQEARATNHGQYFLNLEAREATGCIRIISTKFKSRAGLLILRGKTVGALYGRIDLGEQLFGQTAQKNAMSDLVDPRAIIEFYELREETVVAASTLFQGEVLEFGLSEDFAPILTFEAAWGTLVANGNPGCIIVSDGDGHNVAVVHVYKRSLIGLYSYDAGWVEPTWANAVKIVTTTPGVRIRTSTLSVSSIEESLEHAFSLSGLGDNAKIRVSDPGRTGSLIFDASEKSVLESLRTTGRLTPLNYR